MQKIIVRLAGLAGLALTDTANAERFSSGPHAVALIELYTSEGCSSCPPADRWLSSLATHDGLWSAFVPVAYHVDYWNYLGWTDRFARSEFSERQRRAVAAGAARSVYTPGMFVDGGEYLEWRRGRTPTTSRSNAGVLDVEVDDNRAIVDYRGEPSDRLTITVALLGSGLESLVRGGENRGRTLKQDFVVLGLTERRVTTNGESTRSVVALPKTGMSAAQYAIAVRVSEADSYEPLQATGGPIRLPSFSQTPPETGTSPRRSE